MKVGDRVVRAGSADEMSWHVVDVKTDRRGYWLRLASEFDPDFNSTLAGEVWYAAAGFEVVVPGTED